VTSRRASVYFLLALLLLALTAWFSHSLWLAWFGHALVRDEGPAKAEIAVVLAGDDTGRRVAKGAELVRAGYVPSVLVSGPAYFDVHESDAAIAFAVHQGYPASWFIPLPNATRSTREEAAAILQDLRRRGIHSFLLVTSEYHTARAARIYREALRSTGGDIEMRVVAAPNEYFRPGSWWRNREGQKTVFIEWSKTLATALGH
jgi:uncharacterized SAM-binding protein YcdF (DUF218 family)